VSERVGREAMWERGSDVFVGVHSRKQKIPTNLSHDLFYVVVR
jgi:hypothetical protein